MKFLKILLRLIASLASAILVVSGYLFFISTSDKNKEANPETEEEVIQETASKEKKKN